ncbi:alpha/beta fold hydrolase [Deinococcus aquiradiocola]|uniref:Alpha/beta hydrolase n=1 Tax=Deinococcus aquiradiocola TaxID=393059 RepID=A0A917PH91_9DEIO|nr:alpha/beta hydrolase [Deinococcus aquiradiocola]GGJ77966.1 alpha/beta hydrolase [Deinococcus aquiradiocola]
MTIPTPEPAPARHLIAVHGNFASAAWWDDLQAAPPDGWTVHAPNLPGFAGTPQDGEVSVPRYAAWLNHYIEERGLTRPVLLGHSLGGAVVMEAARQSPGTCAGLVLAASAPPGGLITPEENYPVLDLLPGHAALLELSLAALFPSGRPANFGQLLHDAARMAAPLYTGNARALAAWSVDPALLRGLPVLVLGGELDALITPQMVRAHGDALGVPARILPGVGHGFPQEAPERLLEELRHFLPRTLHA